MESFDRKQNEELDEHQKALNAIWESMQIVKRSVEFGEKLPNRVEKVLEDVKLIGVNLELGEGDKNNLSIIGALVKASLETKIIKLPEK